MHKRRLFYLFAVVGVFIANFIYSNYQLFIILLMLLVIPIISVIYIILIRDKVTVSLSMKEVSIRGDHNDFLIVLDNDAYFTLPNIIINLDFSYSNSYKQKRAEFQLDAKKQEKTRIQGKMTLEHAGELQVSISQSYVCDPLKLVRVPLKCSCNKKILVMPILEEPDFYTLSTEYDDIDDTKNYSQHMSGDDSSEIFDIRNYRNGDSMNRIHWKAVAKQNELMVKDFSYPIHKSNCIVVELNQAKTDEERKRLDGVYELAYAIGNLACTKEKQFKLAYHCNMTRYLKIFEVVNHQDLVDAIQNMIREPSYIGNQSYYDYTESDLYDNNRLFYITATLEHEMYDQLDQYRESKAYAYYVKDNNDAGEVTRLEGALIIQVDHNDIKQGLKNVTI